MNPSESEGIARPFTTEQGAEDAPAAVADATQVEESAPEVDESAPTVAASTTGRIDAYADDVPSTEVEDNAPEVDDEATEDEAEQHGLTAEHPDDMESTDVEGNAPEVDDEATESDDAYADDVASTEVDDATPEVEDRATILRLGAREKTTIVIPSTLDFRLTIIAGCERRNRSVVIEEAFRRFLETPPYEPRPYLPDPGTASTVRITATVHSSYIARLRDRAASEARTYPTLATRALYDYAENSPFDTKEARRWPRAIQFSTGRAPPLPQKPFTVRSKEMGE